MKIAMRLVMMVLFFGSISVHADMYSSGTHVYQEKTAASVNPRLNNNQSTLLPERKSLTTRHYLEMRQQYALGMSERLSTSIDHEKQSHPYTVEMDKTFSIDI
ncbi:hypothetical protein C9J01_01890 [Photobacterium rosenbergii]|uniref:DUF3613 domain-containing protein n=1 Tax=Photobacterium rosenbergii TaxID=294936 RepID=A0A2T3NJU8_9GAMM|nr:hypothetical protein C9J01_01890 [Photobacterium rosenbergii]